MKFDKEKITYILPIIVFIVIMTLEQVMTRGYTGTQRRNIPELVCCFLPPQWEELYGENILMVKN